MKEPPFAELHRSYLPTPPQPRRSFSIRPWLLLAVVIFGAGSFAAWRAWATSYREPTGRPVSPLSTDSPGSDVTQLWPLSKPSPTMQVEAQATPQPSAGVALDLGGSSRALAVVQVGVPVLNKQPGPPASVAIQSQAAQEVMPNGGSREGLRVSGLSSSSADMTSGPVVSDQLQPRPSWSPTPAPAPSPVSVSTGSAEDDDRPPASSGPPPTPHPTPHPTPRPTPVVVPPTPSPSPGKEPDRDRDGKGVEMPCKAPGLAHSAGKALSRPAALHGLVGACKP